MTATAGNFDDAEAGWGGGGVDLVITMWFKRHGWYILVR